MIDGEPKAVLIGGYYCVRPWCDCPGRNGFTLHDGAWVKACCGRPTFHSVNERTGATP